MLLQQTRVAQAAPYFTRFVDRFPTVGDLARARLEDVLKAWEGAGYYARARHLHAAAQRVHRERGDRVPASPAELERLPGVGPYIANAIAAIAFDVPVLALEANGLRVGARWTAEPGDLRRAAPRARVEGALRDLLPRRGSGDFNEALMELGETVCLPAHPLCRECPVAAYCRARQELPDPSVLPRRSLRRPRPTVHAAIVAVRNRGRWLVQRRAPTGFLGGLWELPGGKLEAGETALEAARRELREETGLVARTLRVVGTVRHEYSHFKVELEVVRATVDGPAHLPRALRWVTEEEFAALPRPKATVKVMDLLGRLVRE